MLAARHRLYVVLFLGGLSPCAASAEDLVEFLEIANRHHPDNVEALAELAHVYTRVGRYELIRLIVDQGEFFNRFSETGVEHVS